MRYRLKHRWGAVMSTVGVLVIVGATVLGVLQGYDRLPVGIALFGFLLLVVGGIVAARAVKRSGK
jgi:hypothetical protein